MDPATLAMLAEGAGTAARLAPTVIKSARQAAVLGKHIFRDAGNLINRKNMRSAQRYIKGLGKKGGLHKLITQDLGRGISAIRRGIGRGVGYANQAASIGGKLGGALEKEKIGYGSDLIQASGALGSLAQHAGKVAHHHGEIASKYNNKLGSAYEKSIKALTGGADV